MDISLLEDVISACQKLFGTIFKAAYLLGVFGFLRLSNLVPHSMSTYSHFKHWATGDVFFSTCEAVILIKWSKTIQNNNQARLLKIPFLNNHLFPVQALKTCLQWVPGSSNSALFQFKLFGNSVPLTDSRVTAHLKDILRLCGKEPNFIYFHTFRRSGASFAFEHNVLLQDIQSYTSR